MSRALTLVLGLFPWLLAGAESGSGTQRVYSIGTDNAFPYHFLDGDGSPRGMVGELVAEAANRAGVKLRWELRSEGPTAILSREAVDLWPLLTFQPPGTALPSIYSTRPFLWNSFVTLSLHGRGEVRKVALMWRAQSAGGVRRPTLVASATRQAYPSAELLYFSTRIDALSAVCMGQADAAVMEARLAHYLVLKRPEVCKAVDLEAEGLDAPPAPLGLGSTLNAAPAADRIREEIDRMFADGSAKRIEARWAYYYPGESELLYQEEVTRRANRRSFWLSVVLALFSFLLMWLLFRVRAAQRSAVVANAAKSQFLAMISHEIRTPLNGVLGMGHLLADSALDSGQRELLGEMQRSGGTLLHLVNDLVDLSRAEAGKFSLDPANCDVGKVLRETVHAFAPQARARGIFLKMEGLDEPLPLVKADGPRIAQVLTNLVGNALKFTETGGVTVTASVDIVGAEASMRVEVADTGPGIDPSNVAKLFEKFSKLSDGQAKNTYGAGLGLAISRELVEAMGGRIGVESELGKGSSFWFAVSLPVIEAKAGDAGGAKVEPVAALPKYAAGASVLVAEDNAVNERIARALLEKMGHRVTTARDGQAALDACIASDFDLVLMDCQMPGMDGFEATREIRRREPTGRRVPIIALTASAMSGEREQCLAAGMDDFLTKPVDPVSLRDMVDRWHARSLAPLQ